MILPILLPIKKKDPLNILAQEALPVEEALEGGLKSNGRTTMTKRQ
jgi:hypothetical protein